MAYRDFTDMSVWKTAMEIVGDIYNLTVNLPKKEDYALCSQIRRAASSIAANIAEGFGRQHTKDKLNFYFYSRGSSFETRNHLLIGNMVGYFDLETTGRINEKCLKVIEELNKLISFLEKRGGS